MVRRRVPRLVEMLFQTERAIMNDKSNPNRSRRSTDSRRKASQFDASKARSERPLAEKGQGRGKDPLAGRRSRAAHQGVEGGALIVAFVRPMQDPETGREWERVFLFEVESAEEIGAAEAWLEEHYPDGKEGGQ